MPSSANARHRHGTRPTIHLVRPPSQRAGVVVDVAEHTDIGSVACPARPRPLRPCLTQRWVRKPPHLLELRPGRPAGRDRRPDVNATDSDTRLRHQEWTARRWASRSPAIASPNLGMSSSTPNASVALTPPSRPRPPTPRCSEAMTLGRGQGHRSHAEACTRQALRLRQPHLPQGRAAAHIRGDRSAAQQRSGMGSTAAQEPFAAARPAEARCRMRCCSRDEHPDPGGVPLQACGAPGGVLVSAQRGAAAGAVRELLVRSRKRAQNAPPKR